MIGEVLVEPETLPTAGAMGSADGHRGWATGHSVHYDNPDGFLEVVRGFLD